MSKTHIFLLAFTISSFFLLAQCAETKPAAKAAAKPAAKVVPKGNNESAAVADPNEELKEAGLKCLLDILYKIEKDRGDGNFKGNLQSDGKPKGEDMKLNQLFKMGVDQGIDVTTLLLQYYNIEKNDITIADGGNQFKINLRNEITACKLNMEKPLKRCEFAYKKLKGAQCERVRWGGDKDEGNFQI